MEQKLEQLGRINAAAYANGYNPLLSRTNAIGYRPNALKYADRKRYPNTAEEFLINSYTIRNDIENHGSLEQYTTDSELIMLSMMEKRDYTGIEKIQLPASIPLALSLGDTILKRRSVCSYTGDPITLNHLATVLRAGYGVSTKAIVRSHIGTDVSINLRTVPSGGGLYPLTLYIVALNINRLTKGVYAYSSNEDILCQVGDETMIKNILSCYAARDEEISFSRASFICLVVGSAWKSMRKYGNKGLRFMLQEIGSVTQNIHLSNVALGLGSTDCAAYYENEINKIFNFDGVNQSVLHSIVSGING